MDMLFNGILGARYYSSEFGMFLSVDPLASDYAAWSPYNYVLGNPLMFTDPTGMSAESIHEDADGNKIAEIDDGDHRIYRHDDLGGNQSDTEKIMKLYFKRLKHGNGGGGDHQKFRSDMNLAGNYIKNKFGGSFEGNQQQHTGENWTVYGEGSPKGWSIKAPNASSNGYNRNFDISGINWSGKGMGGTYLKTYFGKNSEIVRFHNVIKGLNKGKSAYSNTPGRTDELEDIGTKPASSDTILFNTETRSDGSRIKTYRPRQKT